MRSARTGVIVLFAILFLFFLQVLSDFWQSIYAFALLVTAFTVQLVAAVLLFTPLALVFLRKPPSRPWVIGIASVAILGRLLEPMLEPGGRLVACAISVGAFMLLFPSLLGLRVRYSILGWSLASGLVLAVMLSILFRTAGASLDLSEAYVFQFVAWVLAVLAARLLWELQMSGVVPEGASEAGPRASTGRVIALCVGMVAVFVMIYFAFASPTVIARWTGASYEAIVAVMAVTLAVFAYVLSRARAAALLRRRLLLAWNALFVLMLVLTIFPQQVLLPAQPGVYPLEPAPVSLLAQLPLYVMLILSPVIFLDFVLYARLLSAEGSTIRQLGWGFAVAGLFILIMVFLHVFTTTYDYTAPVGPLFRDRFWLVYLVAGLALGLPVLMERRARPRTFPPREPSPFAFWTTAALAALIGGALILTTERPALVQYSGGALRVMTYNIQQGFDRYGTANLMGQLGAIQRVDPDILGLEESDTARVANGNVDAVRYFASNLGMYSYYGPTTTTGTFGIALLSKYPIHNPRTFFMYSTGEQTACIQAEITVGGKTYNVFVTHLGNGGPMVQLQNVLHRVDKLPDVLLMGDFNFGPRTDQFALATQTLQDSWLVRWPGGHMIFPTGGDDRIDLLFVSPGTQVVKAEYVPDPASDHPYYYADVKR